MSFKISIITPSFNSGKYIEEVIRNVLAQEYDNFEHIIVDGGSTDNTLDILKKYSHLKWVSEPDKGQSNAMNKGFIMSSGAIIGYLNADDYYLPDAFKSVLPYFEKGAKFVVGKIKVFMDNGKFRINDAKTDHWDMLRHWEPNSFCVNPVGYFYLREVQEKVKGFNESNTFSMDLEFLLAASKHYEFTKIDELLGVFRYYENTKTFLNQKSEDLWTVNSFCYIDQYLEGMPEDVVKKFIKDREEGYQLRRKRQKEIMLKEIQKGS